VGTPVEQIRGRKTAYVSAQRCAVLSFRKKRDGAGGFVSISEDGGKKKEEVHKPASRKRLENWIMRAVFARRGKRREKGNSIAKGSTKGHVVGPTRRRSTLRRGKKDNCMTSVKKKVALSGGKRLFVVKKKKVILWNFLGEKDKPQTPTTPRSGRGKV